MDGRPADARRVILTGAAGTVGSAVAPLLPDAWDLQLTDLRADGRIAALDVTDAAACETAFAAADAVVHLAGVPDPGATWDQLQSPNLTGVHHVAQAAADCGVRRLVLASSLQAVSAYPDELQVRAGDPPRPANLYGATKAWAEAVGSWLAAATPVTVVALRIGHFGVRPPSGAEATARNLAAWLSSRDAAELIRAAVQADVAGFTVVSGVSANRHRQAAHGDAEAGIGYRPRDDAWTVG